MMIRETSWVPKAKQLGLIRTKDRKERKGKEKEITILTNRTRGEKLSKLTGYPYIYI